jgi:hypothetical protein
MEKQILVVCVVIGTIMSIGCVYMICRMLCDWTKSTDYLLSDEESDDEGYMTWRQVE